MEKPQTIEAVLTRLVDFVKNDPMEMSDEAYIGGAAELLKNIIEERVIGEGVPMTFKNSYPVFNSLEEYIEHVSLIRKVQRDEQRQALKQVLKGEQR